MYAILSEKKDAIIFSVITEIESFFLHFAAFSLLIFAPPVYMYVCMCADWKCVMIREISVGNVSSIYAYFSFIADDNSVKGAGGGGTSILGTIMYLR